jgi:ElaB/YqjD/DUF883 family membrane-anchored ribosome-binding protein
VWLHAHPVHPVRAYHATFFSEERHMPNSMSDQQDQLVNDLRAVVRDAQQLLDSGVSNCGAQASQARQRLESAMREVRQSWAESGSQARQHLSQWQQASDEYVHQHPWTTVGMAIGMGVAMGWLLGRR